MPRYPWPAGTGRLGLLLPDPHTVVSPVRATSLVGELADSVAYTHGLSEVAVEKGWWSRRICPRLSYARCVEEPTQNRVVESPELLEVLIDGSTPRIEPQANLTSAEEKTLLRYYIDSRRGGILFLGASRVAAHA